MEERIISQVVGQVLIYDSEKKHWLPAGSSSGLSTVRLIHCLPSNTFRIHGQKINDAKEVVLDNQVTKDVKYNRPVEGFIQWHDSEAFWGINCKRNTAAKNSTDAEFFEAVARVSQILKQNAAAQQQSPQTMPAEIMTTTRPQPQQQSAHNSNPMVHLPMQQQQQQQQQQQALMQQQHQPQQPQQAPTQQQQQLLHQAQMLSQQQVQAQIMNQVPPTQMIQQQSNQQQQLLQQQLLQQQQQQLLHQQYLQSQQQQQQQQTLKPASHLTSHNHIYQQQQVQQQQQQQQIQQQQQQQHHHQAPQQISSPPVSAAPIPPPPPPPPPAPPLALNNPRVNGLGADGNGAAAPASNGASLQHSPITSNNNIGPVGGGDSQNGSSPSQMSSLASELAKCQLRKVNLSRSNSDKESECNNNIPNAKTTRAASLAFTDNLMSELNRKLPSIRERVDQRGDGPSMSNGSGSNGASTNGLNCDKDSWLEELIRKEISKAMTKVTAEIIDALKTELRQR